MQGFKEWCDICKKEKGLHNHHSGTIQPGERIIFGEDSVESIKEKQRQEEAESKKDKH